MKIYTADEADELHWLSKLRYAQECTEEYVVRFRNQTNPPFWEVKEISYFASSRSAHDEVENLWRKEYPYAELISVKYQ